jgi:hypothetical protein
MLPIARDQYWIEEKCQSGKLTGREVVADRVPHAEAGVQGAGLAEVHGAADLLGVDPDDLGEVTPSHEVAHVGLATVEVGRVEVELAVVPHVADGLGNGLGGTETIAVAGTPHGKVLAVATAAGGPVGWCQFYMKCDER